MGSKPPLTNKLGSTQKNEKSDGEDGEERKAKVENSKQKLKLVTNINSLFALNSQIYTI